MTKPTRTSNPYESPKENGLQDSRRHWQISDYLLCAGFGALVLNVPIAYWSAFNFLSPNRHLVVLFVTGLGAMVGVAARLLSHKNPINSKYWWLLISAVVGWLIIFPKQ